MTENVNAQSRLPPVIVRLLDTHCWIGLLDHILPLLINVVASMDQWLERKVLGI